jgi:hypothetical protein
VTLIDWLIVVLLVIVGLWGYHRGFVVGLLSLLGFVGGAWLGTRIGPALLPEGSESPYAPLFGLAGALIAGAILAMGLESIGLRIRSSIRLPAVAVVDGALGAVLSACVALGIVWILGAFALTAPDLGDFRRDVQRSAILQRLNAALPPSGPILNALARFDPFPTLDGPPADVAPPPRGIARDPEVQAAKASTVRIVGTACGLGVQGSGWVAPGGYVVTNAHVVAGQDDTTVQPEGEGPRYDAQAVYFSARNDIAVLQVDGLDLPELELDSDPRSGQAAAILGYPEDGPFTVRPGRLGQTETVLTQNAYGEGPIRRTIVSFRGRVRSGNSGGPLVDRDGEVVATVFASTRGDRPGGYGVPNSIVREALARSTTPVSTGPCAG